MNKLVPDPGLEAAIREKIGKPSGDLTISDLTGMTGYLNAIFRSIKDLIGLEYCSNLTEIDLLDNQITDISPLANLTKLTSIDLNTNKIIDISPLASLTNLTVLYLWNNQITNISALANLTKLIEIELEDNQINDISALIENSGFGKGDYINIEVNPLSAKALQDVKILKKRGVDVNY